MTFTIIALALVVVWLSGVPQQSWIYWRYAREAKQRAKAAQRSATEAAIKQSRLEQQP